MRKKLAPVQQTRYKRLLEYMLLNPHATIREMCENCDIPSTSNVHLLLDQLSELGFVVRGERHKSRNNRITEQGIAYVVGTSDAFVKCPCCKTLVERDRLSRKVLDEFYPPKARKPK